MLNPGFNLASGNIATGSYTLTLGTGTASLGDLNWTSGMIIGNFTRWFNSGTTASRLFPIRKRKGTQFKLIEIKTTTLSTGGKIRSKQNTFRPSRYLQLNPFTDAGGYTINSYSKAGKSVITAGNGLNIGTSGSYDIKITSENILGVGLPSELRLVKRLVQGNPWYLEGNHSAGDGFNNETSSCQTGLISFGEFAISGKFDINPLDGALPVELASFTSNVISRDVKLNWVTASEINNAGFEILRSAQNDTWVKVGYVTGNGTKTSPTNYTFENISILQVKWK